MMLTAALTRPQGVKRIAARVISLCRLRVQTGLAPLGCICLVVALGACREERYKWAFAQNLDNSFNENELCRESLAESLYAPDNQDRTERQGGSNIFVFRGLVESYRVYAFGSQEECERALTGMLTRQAIPRGQQ